MKRPLTVEPPSGRIPSMEVKAGRSSRADGLEDRARPSRPELFDTPRDVGSWRGKMFLMR